MPEFAAGDAYVKEIMPRSVFHSLTLTSLLTPSIVCRPPIQIAKAKINNLYHFVTFNSVLSWHAGAENVTTQTLLDEF